MVLSLALSVFLAVDPVSLPAWNAERLHTQQVGMGVLGAWAVANLGVGVVGAVLAKDERTRWFYLGNASWNLVNLGLAIVGLASDWRTDPASFDGASSLRASTSTVTVYGVNAGLDVAYLAAGAFLWQRGLGVQDERMVGMGQALLVQGAFLLAFDVVMAVLHSALSARLFDGVVITPR
jgi:hypothetical protein